MLTKRIYDTDEKLEKRTKNYLEKKGYSLEAVKDWEISFCLFKKSNKLQKKTLKMQPLIHYGIRWTSRLNKFHPKIKEQPLASFFATFRTFRAGNESQLSRSSSPPPIQVGFTESAGRGVFATRRIEAGELINTAKPIVSHPSLSSLQSVCYFCLKKLPQIIPSQTDDGVLFCSEECRQQSEVSFCFINQWQLS